ncbi:MAG: hypothetical protein ACQESC_00635 [Nanobdellota archaeon]
MKNQDELYVRNIASQIPGVTSRLGTAQEDCGYNKADVILTYNGNEYYIQVSHTPKSKKEQKKLSKRGTHPIHTHKFQELPLDEKIIYKNIEEIINN